MDVSFANINAIDSYCMGSCSLIRYDERDFASFYVAFIATAR